MPNTATLLRDRINEHRETLVSLAQLPPAPNGKWDNRNAWDNRGSKFDNRPSWDNWNKK